MKASDEKEEYIMEMTMPNLNGLGNIVVNWAIAHYEQMLNFPQCFQK